MPPTLGLLMSSLLLFESVVFTHGNGVVPPGNVSTLPRARRSWNSIRIDVISSITNIVNLDCEGEPTGRWDRETLTYGASAWYQTSGTYVEHIQCKISVDNGDAFAVIQSTGGSSTYYLQKDGIFRSNGNAEKQLYARWKDGGTPAPTTATTPREPPREPTREPDGSGVACPEGWIYSRQFKACYYVIVDTAAADCEETCRHEGAHLVSIHSKEENDFVGGLLRDVHARYTMIGLQRNAEGRYQWTDGSTNGKMGLRVEDPWFQYWRTGEPNNLNGNESCVAMDPHEPYGWNDIPCDQRAHNLVCKKEAFQVEEMRRTSP